MLTEDFCSYEIAELLKEKGFDERGLCVYNIYNRELIVFGDWVENSCLLPHLISAPTHQMAMKYLRKVYGLHITIKPYITTEGIMFAFEIYNLEEDRFRFTLLESKAGFEKSEEAVDAAIKCCLTNLILNYYENIERI